MLEVMMVLFMLQKMVEKHGRISQNLPKELWVSNVFASNHDEKIVYLSLMDIGGTTFRLIFSRVKIMVRHGKQLVLIYQIHQLML